MGPSAQNSSGVHWCRRRARFNEVPEKVPEKVWQALVQSQVRFNRVPEKVPVKVWEETRFRRRFSGGFGAEPGQVQQGSGECSGEGLGGFGAEPGQVQQGSGEGRGGLVQSQVMFNRVPEKVPEKVWEASVQSQVKFNRVLEKVPVKVWEETRFRRRFSGGFGAEPGQVQQGSGEGSRCGRLWCRARSGSAGFAAIELTETQLRCFQRLVSQHASERFVKIKRCGCWGYHRSLF